LLRAVTEQGYTEATPIQAQAIPVVLSGRDLLAAAQTGTGKTAGFTLPMLQRLSGKSSGSTSPARHPVRALVLVPTRELAIQVQESVRDYGKHLKLSSVTIFGGVGFNPQADALRRGVDIVVATPGRLLDHVQQKTIDLRQVEILVLDEADRMLDMGFIPDIRRILALLPTQRQNLLFSATFSDDIRKLANGFMKDPASVEVARRNAPIELVTQLAHPVDKDRKRELLAHMVKTNQWSQVLVFTKTKHGANRLAEQLTRDGIESDAIHGNKAQNARTRTLKRFKDNELQVLVATDIAARGIDIEALPHVVNFDLPNVSEDYVHRIGRTGRAGATGEAISLVSGEDRPLLRDIERLINMKIELRVVEGFEPSAAYLTAQPEPEQRGRRGRSSQGAGNGERKQSQGQRNNGQRNSGRRQPQVETAGQPEAQARQGREKQRPQQGKRVASTQQPRGGNAQQPRTGNSAQQPRTGNGNRRGPQDQRRGAGAGAQGSGQRQARQTVDMRGPDHDEREAQRQYFAQIAKAEQEAERQQQGGQPEQPQRSRIQKVAALFSGLGRKAA
jgi:ATP-dependent RNA helicase RhlE